MPGRQTDSHREARSRLPQLDIGELRQLWCRLYKTEASPHLGRELLLQAIRLPKITRVLGRAVPCSAVARRRHKIIRNRLALLGEESVSVGHRRHPAGSTRRTHPCASTLSATTESCCAARRRQQ